MSDQSGKGITAAQRIRGLKRRIDESLMELTDVEVLLNTRPHTAPRDNARLEEKKLLLTNLIVEMDTQLKQLRDNYPAARQRIIDNQTNRSTNPTKLGHHDPVQFARFSRYSE